MGGSAARGHGRGAGLQALSWFSLLSSTDSPPTPAHSLVTRWHRPFLGLS